MDSVPLPRLRPLLRLLPGLQKHSRRARLHQQPRNKRWRETTGGGGGRRRGTCSRRLLPAFPPALAPARPAAAAVPALVFPPFFFLPFSFSAAAAAAAAAAALRLAAAATFGSFRQAESCSDRFAILWSSDWQQQRVSLQLQ